MYIYMYIYIYIYVYVLSQHGWVGGGCSGGGVRGNKNMGGMGW